MKNDLYLKSKNCKKLSAFANSLLTLYGVWQYTYGYQRLAITKALSLFFAIKRPIKDNRTISYQSSQGTPKPLHQNAAHCLQWRRFKDMISHTAKTCKKYKMSFITFPTMENKNIG
ncbi:hypothetical protein MMC97_07630 [Clostridioides difficile]|nr:hypothetical protein [Clostridioides difficile]MCI4291800.1 hypothetical protein [Clostridioides difficile]MCM4095762.1 hypothetical protein [Clostridioides difficile]MDB9634326.1 hypothetical protein [Clostridioides difficile]MDM0140876.1 hypothetical protein [Clostridioides difficile]